MDYYEEFGVPRTATPNQIRQAYKGLARILHPDHFQDPGLRQLAESQMKRINEIFALLSDPARRRQYDEPPAALPPYTRYRGNAGWFVAVVVALAWAVTSLVRSPVPVANSVPSMVATPQPAPVAAAPPPPRAVTRPAPRARHEQTGESGAGPAAGPDSGSDPDPPAVDAPPAAAAVEIPAAVSAQSQPPPPKPKGLSGRWLYLRPALAPPSKELYPPEYIEAAIVEENDGTLRGRYRARYRVADRAISPEVEFQFQGVASGDAVSLPWTGGGGSRGQVQLHQVSADSLEVTWFATELGKYLGLASGTAVLVRRQDP